MLGQVINTISIKMAGLDTVDNQVMHVTVDMIEAQSWAGFTARVPRQVS